MAKGAIDRGSNRFFRLAPILVLNGSLLMHILRLAQFRVVCLLALIVILPASQVSAQQVATDPTSTHIFPAGGRRGTVVPVRVGGECLPPYTRFRLVGDGVSADAELVEKVTGNYEASPRRKPGETPMNYPREWKSAITIAADAPLGQKLWRVSSARGGTGARPFMVGDLPEFIETESNSVPEKAEQLTLPVVVNGQIAGERDLDYFRFTGIENDVVSIDVAAARLGSSLDPVVELTDENGRRLPIEGFRIGSDPVLVFRVPKSGEYRLLVTNLNFRGGPQYVYRITISTAPFVKFAFPPGGLAGTSGTVELFSAIAANSTKSWTEKITFPAGPAGPFVFSNAISSPHPVLLETTDLPTLVEAEPNDGVSTATSILPSMAAYGRLSRSADEDWYTFTAVKDQPLTIECRAFPPGFGALPVVTVCDAGGLGLATVSTAEKLPAPCRIDWRAPADGKFLIRVRDVRQGQSDGVDAPYCLTVRPTRLNFTLTATTDNANMVQGARGEIDLKIDRQGGFFLPIDLHIDGLPSGVRVEPVQIPAGLDQVKLAFIAEGETRPGDSILKITGKAKSGNEIISCGLTAKHLGRDTEDVSLGLPTVDHLQLTVRHKPVFRLHCNEAYQYAYRGTIYPYLMEIDRLDGFDGPVTLEMADRQIKDLDGVEIINSTFSAGTSQLMLPLYMPENMHINVQAHSNVYSQGYVVFQDKWGQRQSMLQVSEMRCMIRPLPTVVKLRVVEKSIALRPGEKAGCTLHLDRTTNFSGALSVELVSPPPGIRLERVTIPADATDAVAVLSIAEGVTFSPQRQLTFRAQGDLPGGVKVVSEATVPVFSGP
ncbi:MAG: hypothetical protein JWM11_3543 [Planctomycetaceae bacterium]|nr:hypothetical protein [Planctomycetaceae bacterium]